MSDTDLTNFLQTSVPQRDVKTAPYSNVPLFYHFNFREITFRTLIKWIISLLVANYNLGGTHDQSQKAFYTCKIY